MRCTRFYQEFFKACATIDFSVVFKDDEKFFELISGYLEFSVNEYPSGSELDGWRVPNHVEIKRADISDGQTRIFEYSGNPLELPASCPSFTGDISGAELKNHLFYSEKVPTAIPYHWRNLYVHWNREWGFCVTKRFYDSIDDEKIYSINLETEESSHSAKVYTCFLPGKSGRGDTYVFHAHNCHPRQSNDDISGIAAGIKLFSKLSKLADLKHNYILIIGPEIIGTVHWLHEYFQSSNGRIDGSVMLKAVGNYSDLKLQESFRADSKINLAFRSFFKSKKYHIGGFRRIYGNDETAFEAPLYRIPAVSVTRYPFEEYHTSADKWDRLDFKGIDEVVDVCFRVCISLERNFVPKFASRGLVCLSDPRLNLYKRAYSPGTKDIEMSEVDLNWNLFMNCLPMEADGRIDLISLADRYNLNADEVIDYVEKFVEAGLCERVIEA